MDTGPLDMLHDARDNDVVAVAHSVNLGLDSLKVLIYKDRVILCISVDDIHELFDLVVGKSYLHALSTKNVGRTYKYRVS